MLLFGSRRIAATKARRGRSVRATIRPGLQRAAVAALGDRLGGIAVAEPRDGSVLALSGLAIDGAQPPGSTFKIITLSAALQNKIATPSSAYPVRHYAVLSGVKLRNASDESCGGSLVQAFTVSCNSVFAPLGARLGAQADARRRRALRLQRARRAIPGAGRARSPTDLKDDLAVGAASIGQERDLATPLQMAAVGATIANRGVHPSPRIVALGPGASASARCSRTAAAQVRDDDARRRALRHRHGGGAARRRGRRQDRHRRAAPDRERPAGPEEHRRLVRRLRARGARRRSPSR